MGDVPPSHSPGPPVRVAPSAELAGWRFDVTRFLGNALAPLAGDLPVWREDGEQASLAARLAHVDALLWQHFGIRAETLAISPETERRHWRAYNRRRLLAFLEGTADVPGLAED